MVPPRESVTVSFGSNGNRPMKKTRTGSRHGEAVAVDRGVSCAPLTRNPPRLRRERDAHDRAPPHLPLCEAMCGLRIEVEDGRVARFRPNHDDVWSRGYICPKG